MTNYTYSRMNYLQAAQEKCLQTFEGKVDPDAVRRSFAVIKAKYEASAEKVTDNLGRYLKRNVLTVPAHVVLPEDQVQLPADHPSSAPYTKKDLERDLAKYEEHCRAVKDAKYKKAVLERKLGGLQLIVEEQRNLLKHLEVLADVGKALTSVIRPGIGALEEKVDGSLMPLFREAVRASSSSSAALLDGDDEFSSPQGPEELTSILGKMEAREAVLKHSESRSLRKMFRNVDGAVDPTE